MQVSCHYKPFRKFFHVDRISEPLQRGLEITLTWVKGCPEMFRLLTQTKGRGAGPDGTEAKSGG